MIQIRYAKIEDVEGMVDVNLKTWRTTYSGIISEGFLLARENKRVEIIDKRKNNFSKLQVDGRKIYQCVVLDDRNIIGIATYGKCRGEEEFGLINSGEIYSIYILKEFQGRGIGKKLINFAVRDLRDENYDMVVIWSLKDNPSVGFYKRIGGKDSLTRTIEIGNQRLEEIGFVFDDMDELINITGTFRNYL